jgi:hypothetical protein
MAAVSAEAAKTRLGPFALDAARGVAPWLSDDTC